MIDVREQILLRLVAILGGVSGLLNVYRDRDVVPPIDKETLSPNLPAAWVLQGGERKRGASLGRYVTGEMPPQLMTMTPQIWIVLMPTSTVANANQGALLSSYRVEVINAVIHDVQLITLIGTNGEIEFTDCVTDMQSGGDMEGQMHLGFAFTYVLNPSDLS